MKLWSDVKVLIKNEAKLGQHQKQFSYSIMLHARFQILKKNQKTSNYFVINLIFYWYKIVYREQKHILSNHLIISLLFFWNFSDFGPCFDRWHAIWHSSAGVDWPLYSVAEEFRWVLYRTPVGLRHTPTAWGDLWGCINVCQRINARFLWTVAVLSMHI